MARTANFITLPLNIYWHYFFQGEKGPQGMPGYPGEPGEKVEQTNL